MLKVATWNVNSLRVRLPQVLNWVKSYQPDILALQETKMPDEAFPAKEIESAGYHVVYSGQRTYNGVALLSRKPIKDITRDLPGLADPQRRVLAVTVGSLRVINLYVPNGQSVGSEKYQYKLDWLEKLRLYIKKQLKEYKDLIVLGDFNIAFEDRDVHDPKVWEGNILVSDLERKALKEVVQEGLQDAFRLFDKESGGFSWWDYRMGAFRRNLGLRLDLILLSNAMVQRCERCVVDKEPRRLERPSDHAPVIAVFR